MLKYYTAISVIVWLALLILCTLVYENDRISTGKRKIFYLTYVLIFIASLAEWVGVYISGITGVPAVCLRTVKCIDYILTPIAGAALVGQMRLRNVWTKILNIVILFNTLFQLVSFFTGWMTIVDEKHYYHHGPLYIIYIGEYVIVLLLVIILFLNYGKNFRKQNRLSIYLVMVFMLVGIIMQEGLGKDVRTAYLAMTIGATLMFIHSTEYSQQKKDDELLEQRIQIKTDALTGLLSRYAYNNALDKYTTDMPESLVAFSIDINGLKRVNDTLGHEAGDELICGAAACIKNVFDEVGSCYRTGGDEFIVLASMSKKEAVKCVQDIEKLTKNWTGSLVDSLALSVGYAVLEEHKDCNCSELIQVADKQMYMAKDEYYRTTKIDRRKF
jgi:diguanylate cyclase (GGDEF)-like protein